MLTPAPLRCFSSLVLLVITTATLADHHLTSTIITPVEPRWYAVEMIIFENLDVPRSPNTLWDEQAYIPRPGDKIANDAITVQPPSAWLTDIAATIEKSSRYQLLLHLSWRQAFSPSKSAVPMRIQQGRPIPVFAAAEVPKGALSFLSVNPATSNGTIKRGDLQDQRPTALSVKVAENFQPVFTDPDTPLTGTYTQVFAYPLDGTITLTLHHYLHVRTELALTRINASSQLQSFIVKSHRRMRSRELHYIDHPKVGILIWITPVSDSLSLNPADKVYKQVLED